jgi:cellulose biosynthesis protein BcsQ
VPITEYAPTSQVAADYRAVAAEILERIGDLSS